MTDTTVFNPSEYRRRLAQSLLRSGLDASPVGHWTQGLARLAQAFVGANAMSQEDEREQQQIAEANNILLSHPALAANQPAQMASASPQPMGKLPGMPSTVGKIYENDEPSPLDPPAGADRDNAVRTIVAEARNQGPVGMQAVGNVIRNRAVNGGFGGDTPTGVVRARSQFEPWNTAAGRQRMAAIDPNSPAYQAAGAALDRAYAGDDPTGGATHFYAPKAQAALGRPAPAWDNGTGQNIGDHRFFGGVPGGPPAVGTPIAQAATPAAQPIMPAPMQAYIRGLISNPRTRAAGLQMLSQYSKPSEPEWKSLGKDADGREVHGWTDPRSRTVTPYTLPGSEPPANSVIPAPPPGVDRKIWNKEQSERFIRGALPATMEDEAKLRGEIQGLPSYKNLAQAMPVYRSMIESAGRNDRGSDLDIIYGVAKLLDPGSVVRESEMSIAQAVATLPEKLKAEVASQMQGTGRLSQETRASIMQVAASRLGAYKGAFDQDAQMYRGVAEKYRAAHDRVIPSFGELPTWKPPTPAAQDAQRLKSKYGLE